jgi:hypothetical protein
MLDFLRHLKNESHDVIFFLPGDKENELEIKFSEYANYGEKIGNNSIGDLYEIILFKEDKIADKLYGAEKFEAILGEPLEYISNMILSNLYGIIAKKTTTSGAFVQKTFDKLQEV